MPGLNGRMAPSELRVPGTHDDGECTLHYGDVERHPTIEIELSNRAILLPTSLGRTVVAVAECPDCRERPLPKTSSTSPRHRLSNTEKQWRASGLVPANLAAVDPAHERWLGERKPLHLGPGAVDILTDEGRV